MMLKIDERIERKLIARGVDVQSDAGARLFQSEVERAEERRTKYHGGIVAKPSDFTTAKHERVRGVMI